MTDYMSDDLATLFVPPNVEQPPRYVIAVLEQWDPDTFQNSVRYRGTLMHNLAVINSVEALSFSAGQSVALLGHSGTGALTSFAILGRYLQPGSSAATEAVSFLQGELARQISAEIFAERISTATVPTQQSTTSATFTDLATVGPQITGVEIQVGVAIVFASAGIFIQFDQDQQGTGGYMGVQISGATSVSPAESESLVYSMFPDTIPGDEGLNGFLRASNMYPFTGLNPGTHTFTAKYRRSVSGGQAVEFLDRAMMVIAF